MKVNEFRKMIAKDKDGKEKEFVETEPRHINHHESVLQQSCKRWFDLQYPQFSKLLFAVPNGGWRSKVEAVIMRREGVVAGVADMILLMPRGGYASLCIEFKTRVGRLTKQRESQIEWQRVAEREGNKYVVVRSVEDFIANVKKYLRG